MGGGGESLLVTNSARVCTVVGQCLIKVSPTHIRAGSVGAIEVVLRLSQVVVAQPAAQDRYPVLNTRVVRECMATVQKIVGTLNLRFVCHSLNGSIDSFQVLCP